MSRESLKTRIQRGPDDGGALVAVIGIMVVLTILVTTIVTTSLFNVRMTTETRAGVEARAAAEAGVDYVRAQVAAGKCSSGTVTSPAGSPEFEAVVTCSGAGNGSVLIRSTGTAQSSGVGSSNGNQRSVEALIETAVSESPTFNAAIFSGRGVNLKTNMNLLGSGADVVTNGSFVCSSNVTTDGSVYAAKDVTLLSRGCNVTGSVYSGGTFNCNQQITIGGNVYAQGSAQFGTPHCKVGGEIWTGGSIESSRGIDVAGNLTIDGNMPVDGTSIKVGGQITMSGVYAGGPSGGWWYGEFAKQYPDARQNQTVGKPPTGDAATSMEFPVLRQDDSLWNGFIKKSWVKATKDVATPSSMSMCSMGWSGPQFSAPLVIAENTMFDLTSSTECSGRVVLGAGLTIQLQADAVIFADEFDMNGNVRVESVDGTKHSLYLVTPYPRDQTSCAVSTGGSKITFTSGSWTQTEGTSVMLYSADKITFKAEPQLRGQIYSCQFDAETKMDLVFSKTGASDSDGSASKPTLKYVRDITD